MKADSEGFQADEMKASSVNHSASLNGCEAACNPKKCPLVCGEEDEGRLLTRPRVRTGCVQ